MRIRSQCRECGLPFRAQLTEDTERLPCPSCGVERPVDPEAWEPGRVGRCALCGCEHLYGQKDINRALGCGLVVAGAALAFWTYGLSLVAVLVIDLLLYYRLRLAVVCYRCDTVYRDARPTSRQGEFDLLKHDVVKYGKTWHLADGEGKKIAPEI